ncbi:unnamed protein product [Paramecium primaurelia]|uniref:Tetratricopeptide repeat protein n=1 Tax=Paramecium primaurelia TaxID=5886 RepID=A0A8S1Q683_PARPR|nr:unnamed protein product [Paramecium primaurelia]
MDQETILNLKCQQNDHFLQIETVCYNQFCEEFRLNCLKCINEGAHHSHFNDVQKVHSLEEFLQNCNQKCDQFINELKKFIEGLNQSFSQFTKGIREKYSFLKGKYLNINLQQINDFLNQALQFKEYRQSITNIIQEQSKKINHSFQNLYEQLKLYQLSYNLKNDNDIKQSQEFYSKGYKLYCDSQLDQSIEQLDVSIQLDPNNFQSLWCKGACLRLQDKYDDALIWLDKALAINPKHVNSLSNKGTCLRSLKRFEDSLKCFDLALSIDPFNTFSLQTKGLCLQDQEKYLEAVIYYEKSLKYKPNDKWVKNQKDFCEQKLKQ